MVVAGKLFNHSNPALISLLRGQEQSRGCGLTVECRRCEGREHLPRLNLTVLRRCRAIVQLYSLMSFLL